MNEHSLRKIMERKISPEQIKSVLMQGLEHFVENYNAQNEFQKQYGFGYTDHWGKIPDRIGFRNVNYAPQEILDHAKQRDDIGVQILDWLTDILFKNKFAIYSLRALSAQFQEEDKSGVRIFAGRKEVKVEKLIELARSLDLKVNSMLAMAVYDTIGALYRTQKEQKEEPA